MVVAVLTAFRIFAAGSRSGLLPAANIVLVIHTGLLVSDRNAGGVRWGYVRALTGPPPVPIPNIVYAYTILLTVL
jgi:hypothetical protein